MAKRESDAWSVNTGVLFVCAEHTCLSPMAEGVLRQLAHQAGLGELVNIDSAGTCVRHPGGSPDRRAQYAMRCRGYDLPDIRLRAVEEQDFYAFDMILAMDWDNLSALQQMAPKVTKHKLQLLMRFATDHETATVDDPAEGELDQVLACLEDACSGVLEVVKRRATQVAAA